MFAREFVLFKSGEASLALTIDFTSGCVPDVLIALSIVSSSCVQDGLIVS